MTDKIFTPKELRELGRSTILSRGSDFKQRPVLVVDGTNWFPLWEDSVDPEKNIMHWDAGMLNLNDPYHLGFLYKLMLIKKNFNDLFRGCAVYSKNGSGDSPEGTYLTSELKKGLLLDKTIERMFSDPVFTKTVEEFMFSLEVIPLKVYEHYLALYIGFEDETLDALHDLRKIRVIKYSLKPHNIDDDEKKCLIKIISDIVNDQ